jgi:hypothetical protein
MHAVTKELENMQAEIHCQLAAPAAGQSSSYFDDAEAVQALNGLKAELDQLRRILWFYLEEAAKQPPARSESKPSQRLEQAVPVQRKLTFQSNESSRPAEPAWFFDRLDLVIESYMQKKPAAAETRSVPRRDTKAFS